MTAGNNNACDPINQASQIRGAMQQHLSRLYQNRMTAIGHNGRIRDLPKQRALSVCPTLFAFKREHA
jgi:hypothetical protein